MTDPAEIDLEHLKAKLAIRVRLGKTDSESLIAAVEALQERIAIDGLPCACRFRGVEGAIRHGSETGVLVDPDDPIHECALHAALRERVAEMLDGEMKLSRRVEAAEAHAVELAGALDQLIEEKADYMRLNNLGNPETQHTIKLGRAALQARAAKEPAP